MRAPAILGCVAIGLIVAAGCGGESSSSKHDEPNGSSGEAGAPLLPGEGGARAEAGAAGEASELGGAPGASDGGSASGGRAAGGAAAGGVATGGIATGGSPPRPIPIPDGCKRENEFDGGTSCSLGVTCDEQYISVSCTADADAYWTCSCQGRVSDRYTVKSETSNAACAASTALCLGTDPALEDYPEECEPIETASNDFCRNVETCTRDVQVEDVTVSVEEIHEVDCSIDEGSSAYCSCADNPSLEGKFQGVDLEEGCGFAQAYCRSKKHELVGEPTCVPELLTMNAGYCERRIACGQTVELDDGSTVSRYLGRVATCGDTGTGDVTCNCYDDSGSGFVFDIEGVAASGETCLEAGDLCARSDELELSDQVDCETVALQASGEQCNAGLDCIQRGTIGDTAVGVRAPIQVTCFPGDELWGCGCISGRNDSRVDVEAEDAWTACEAALAACPGTIELDPAGSL